MTRGVLLFAFQGEFDYVGLTLKTAQRVKQYLNLPISIVTDSKDLFTSQAELFDQIIQITDTTLQQKKFYNGSIEFQTNTWKNSNRAMCFELSPYDETLVLDTDYIINSNFLLKCFDIDQDFLIFKESYDLAAWRNTSEFQYITEFSIPFYWATVFYFRKTEKNRLFFELIKYIKSNWDYFRLVYQITQTNFRNDFAFSIAINIFNGFNTQYFENLIPGKMYYVRDRDHLISIADSSCVFLVEKSDSHGQYTAIKVNNLDVHVMNKHSIMEVL